MSAAAFDFDAVIVGAGVIGLACARALAVRGESVLVLEAGPRIGEGVSARNSEVIHAGLYYPDDSLKAKLCVAGRRLLYAYLESKGVGYDKCGKLVVANGADEIARLEKIHAQALKNGVEGLERYTAAQAIALEPALRCDAALWSPESGVFDSHGYMLALRGDIEAAQGHVIVNAPFEGATPIAANDGVCGWTVRVGGAAATTIHTHVLVTAAGLEAQRVAEKIDGYPLQRIPPLHYGKGNYFRYVGKAPFARLVYPPPIPGALGTHYRRNLGGQAIFGPDLQYVTELDYTVDVSRAERFTADVRKFWPAVPDAGLVPDYVGIRPKLHGPGEPQPDYRIDGPEMHGLPGLIALFGIESPGLTSSLALGDLVASRLARMTA